MSHAAWNRLIHALHGNTPTHNPAPSTSSRPSRTKGRPQATIRFRFHNVQGLSKSQFRSAYLRQARLSTDILVLAETNCNTAAHPTAERLWGKDWANGGTGPFWASATKPFSAKARGMANFFSNNINIPVSDARLTYPKPGQNTCCGRFIVVTVCCVRFYV